MLKLRTGQGLTILSRTLLAVVLTTPVISEKIDDVRLVNSGTENNQQGLVEILTTSGWGNICGNFGSLDGFVPQSVCRTLGWSSGSPRFGAWYGQGNGTTYAVRCSSDESLFKCAAMANSGCNHCDDLGVYCYNSTNSHYDIRLVGGSNCSSGRVEVFRAIEWWTVCADDFTVDASRLVCNASRLNSLDSQVDLYDWDTSSRRHYSVCYGNEKSFLECASSGCHACNVMPGKVAGVVCSTSDTASAVSSGYGCDSPGYLEHGEFLIQVSNGDPPCIISYNCNKGYGLKGGVTQQCLKTGQWSGAVPECLIDCGAVLTDPDNGKVTYNGGTLFEATATYTCNKGFYLNGIVHVSCQANGNWSGPLPSCEILGNDSQHCSPVTERSGGKNACIRTPIQELQQKIQGIVKNISTEEISYVLETLSNITNIYSSPNLTVGEVQKVSSFLRDIADISSNTSITLNQTEDFLNVASDLLDVTHDKSWETLRKTDRSGAETVLRYTDTFIKAFTKHAGEEVRITKKNLVVEIKAFPNVTEESDILFPGLTSSAFSQRNMTSTGFFISYKTLLGQNVSVAAMIVRNINGISTNLASSENGGEQYKDIVINGHVLSITILPTPERLNPPVKLYFAHLDNTLSKPSCRYLEFAGKSGTGVWSPKGCFVVSTNVTMTTCECNHLTNFAILMSPLIKVNLSNVSIHVVSIVGISISTVCLLATVLMHIWHWRYMKSDRTKLLLSLCTALVVAYLLFVIGVDRTENKIVCTVIAALLQYTYLVVFCLMLTHGIQLVILALFVFNLRSRFKYFIFLSCVIPAVIVGVSLGITKGEGFGTETFCWLAIDSGLIWAFVGPALLIILANTVCLCIVIKVMLSTKLVENKSQRDKIKSTTRMLSVLLPLLGLTWIIGIFNTNETSSWMPYLFSICNGLQGFLIFLFQCVFNPQLRTAMKLRQNRNKSTHVRKPAEQSRNRKRTLQKSESAQTLETGEPIPENMISGEKRRDGPMMGGIVLSDIEPSRDLQ